VLELLILNERRRERRSIRIKEGVEHAIQNWPRGGEREGGMQQEKSKNPQHSGDEGYHTADMVCWHEG
jgi:hypothetical protein